VLQGQVHGGQQPISQAHIYLFAANTNGYGNPSSSLLNAADTGHSDSVGAYVLSGSNGSFTITGDYSCTANTQVYLYTLGGNAGSGTNSAAGLMAALGNCPASNNFLASDPVIQVNEVTTVAAAYAMAGFATDAVHVSSSGTTLAQIGIANAFANAGNLASIVTGQALATTPAGNGEVPQSEINTLANILASCVNSSGPASTPCGNLLNYTNNSSDTASAVIYIAHNPGANTANLFALSTASAPFAPTLTAVPNDFTVALIFTGVSNACCFSIAIDGSGNAWLTDTGANSVVKLPSTGAILSGANGYTDPNLIAPYGIAIDLSGNAWTSDGYPGGVVEFSPTGSRLSSGANGYPGGGAGIAIDGLGNAWSGAGPIFEISSGGINLSGVSGYADGHNPWGIAIDSSENVWVANSDNTVSEYSNAGALYGYTPVTLGAPSEGGLSNIAIDHSGNAWVTNSVSLVLSEISSNGSILNQFASTDTSTENGVIFDQGVAIDGAGNVWCIYLNQISELSNAGTILSGANGYYNGVSQGLIDVVDGSGDLWAPGGDGTVAGVLEVIGLTTPVVTPLAAGAKNNTLGTRP
jgi:streptogramin lyase